MTAITPGDPRYAALTTRGNNKRFTANPEAFHVAASTADVIEAVTEALRSSKHIAVRSGGHGYENFSGAPGTQLVVDLGEMTAVAFDAERNAFMVEAGARLDDVYRTMYERWGVAVPAGNSATVGLGGHVQGGGYGSLNRRHGLIVDHLHAVEVVVADAATGEARAVVATRDADDPHHDLWWAHTGGGGGSFGIVTRYWFRSPDATGTDPEQLLPRPSAEMLTSTVLFPRATLDKPAFRTLVGAYGRWHERNSAPDSPYVHLFASLVLLGRQRPRPEEGQDMGAVLVTHVEADRPDAAQLLQDFLDEVTGDGALSPVVLPAETVPWLVSKKALSDAQDAETGRQKVKSANLLGSFTDDQADALYDFLDDADAVHDSSLVALDSFGGRTAAVAPDATAAAQRDTVLKVLFMSTWQDPALDEPALAWMRRCYGAVFAKTGGVPAPVPGGNADGCFINFADVDTADPAQNTSGAPWHALYFKDNYRRLQAVKTAYDPTEVFRHPLSVRPS
ncbi:FAD-binding oxidoreductase [Streptomyces sp. NPDC001262]|uniref:FAD-binding oxidoreductase n=1 Tax=unclassified Streptomyces TaxID=2593676 RepID=UPI0036D11701